MIERDIIKHSTKAITNLKDKKIAWKKRISDLSIEILVIVFAISLSLLLERWREHATEKAVAKEFLFALQKDLESDLRELKSDRNAYLLERRAMQYFNYAGKIQKLHKDSIALFRGNFFNNTILTPNNGRFEGLKSSGKLYIIENEVLLGEIMQYYQQDLPFLLSVTGLYFNYKRDNFMGYIDKNYSIEIDILGAEKNLLHLLKDKMIQNFFWRSNSTNQIIRLYESAIDQSNKIINAIRQEYP